MNSMSDRSRRKQQESHASSADSDDDDDEDDNKDEGSGDANSKDSDDSDDPATEFDEKLQPIKTMIVTVWIVCQCFVLFEGSFRKCPQPQAHAGVQGMESCFSLTDITSLPTLRAVVQPWMAMVRAKVKQQKKQQPK
jgi:hypothetical protein